MRSKISGFSLVELSLVVGLMSLITMLALAVVPRVLAKERAQIATTGAQVSSGASAGAKSGSSKTPAVVTNASAAMAKTSPSNGATAVLAEPLTHQFRDVETITGVQAIDTLPDTSKPSDIAARGDWLYVETDEHVLVNGPWAASVCPAFLAGRQKMTPGTSLFALRGLLFQRLTDKRRLTVRGYELTGAQTADVQNCPGVSVSRSGFWYHGKPVAFAAELTLPR